MCLDRRVYMVAVMIGSSLFKICVMRFSIAPEALAKFIFGIAAAALFIPTVTTVCHLYIYLLDSVSFIYSLSESPANCD